MKIRKYHVVGLQLKIVYNKFGDHDPDGLLYILKENEEQIKALVADNPNIPVTLVEPLVLRANQGETIEVTFENQLPFPASIHVHGVEYNVQDSDGAFVGQNNNTTILPGQTVVYRWFADLHGVFHFGDLGNSLAMEDGSNVHGLFGALIVEFPGSTWTHPETGAELLSGTIADIHNPFLPERREFCVFFHDEAEILDINGNKPTNPMTGLPESTMSINYRSEPMRNRMRLIMDGIVCPGCQGEEVHHDSWPFGDPATPVFRGYVGDPARVCLIHGGVKETHVFHWHVHQWRRESNDVGSEQLDSQSISPQKTFIIDALYGIGSLQGTRGDSIYHCHLYPHFNEGMWGIIRSIDRLEDGTRFYPDGTPVPALIPLPDRPAPPVPTTQHPGYPHFLAGTPGEKALRPPLTGLREPTPLEIANFDPNPVPGAPFVNSCPEGAPVRQFHIVAIQLPLIYNDAGWFDPEGRIYVLAEDEEAVLLGRKRPEPLFLRANAGDCIDFLFENKLPETLGPSPFQLEVRTYEAGMHVHFVKFDPIASDGANVGWNYDSGTSSGQTIRYRWFADVELKTVFFHDHLFPNEHQQHGLFAALVVEPAGSTYHDPFTGEEIRSGAHAIIKNPFIPDFREFCLAVHDFVFAFDAQGQPLNPPPFPGVSEDPGVMAYNYKNEPFQFRRLPDPAYVFSSFVHGDPVTPLFEAYAGDPVRIHLIDGAHEEQHSFAVHNIKWNKDRRDVHSPLEQQQTLGISEAFNFEFEVEPQGEKDYDLLYTSSAIDDLWLGCWGLIRVYGQKVPHLLALDDRPEPPKRTIPLPRRTGEVPLPANEKGKPCPKGARVRKYHLVALERRINYNSFEDHDPAGLIFVLADEVQDIIAGNKNPEPLVLRANVNECIEITVSNGLPQDLPIHTHPEVPVEAFWPPSSRISLHPQMLQYFVRGSDGATVGFNPDQTVAPGETVTYRWYADQPYGVINLVDYGDLRSHRHHGLWAVLVVEPEGSRWLHPVTGQPLKKGAEAVIAPPFLPAIREFVVIMQDGIFILNKDDQQIPDTDNLLIKNFPDADGRVELDTVPPEENEPEDAEDQGQKAFNYRAERFRNRLEAHPFIQEIFSSGIHGDPATPLFRAYAGDPVTIRLAMPGDKPRNHSFHIHGYKWREQNKDANSPAVAVDNAVTANYRNNMDLFYGAGGLDKLTGDYMYRSGVIRWDIQMGMWGIIRVFAGPQDDLLPLPVV